MTRSRPILYLLLAAALFVRAFLPQGTMPERSDGGTIAVALCSSGGGHTIPLTDGPAPEEDEQRVQPPCAFAGLGALSAPQATGFVHAAPAPAALAFAEPPASDTPAVAPRLFPPARGPPLPA